MVPGVSVATGCISSYKVYQFLVYQDTHRVYLFLVYQSIDVPVPTG